MNTATLCKDSLTTGDHISERSPVPIYGLPKPASILAKIPEVMWAQALQSFHPNIPTGWEDVQT